MTMDFLSLFFVKRTSIMQTLQIKPSSLTPLLSSTSLHLKFDFILIEK